MKKIIKILLLSFLFVPFINLKAISSNEVSYKINKNYINSEIEIAGGLKVIQIIEVEGTFNGYQYNLATKNTNNVEFTGLDSDLEGSSIYNPSSIEKIRIGRIKDAEDISFDMLSEEGLKDKIEYFEQTDTPKNGDSQVYSLEKTEDGEYRIKMFNETKNSKTVFYLEYTVMNILVEHNDSAEFYYSFLSKDFKDTIKDTKIMVYLPYASEELFKVWAHGQRDATVQKDEGKKGVVAYINNYQVGSGIDIRILFDKELFMININENKKSKMDAIPIVEKIEEGRADVANKYRKLDMFYYYGMYAIEILYICSILGLTVYIYIKYDKEDKSSFQGKYYREFIDDYPVEVVEYLMNKNVTANGFSASILNLIYKKKIEIEKIPKKKDDYKFIKNNEIDLSNSEIIIMNLLFNEIGNGKEVLLSDIKNSAKKVTSSGKSSVYGTFSLWQENVIKESTKQNFYIDNQKIKFAFGLLGILGIMIFVMDFMLDLTILKWFTLALSIIFTIYILSFKKRTKKGNEDYAKWTGFKNFLNDFGRLNEKELPEIKLWERYLVYATIFGVADKLRNTMKIKFNEINPGYEVKYSMFDMYLFSNLTSDISRGISSSVTSSYQSISNYKSNNWSSGSGMGGGFSSGGGHGGGGATGGGF